MKRYEIRDVINPSSKEERQSQTMNADLQEARSLETRLPHVIFQVKDRLYAVASSNVREIVLLPPVTSPRCRRKFAA